MITSLFTIKKATPELQTWLKLVKLFLLVSSSWWGWWRRWWWGRILVVTFSSDHIIFALYLSRVRSGAREKERIQNNSHQGQKHFLHFYEILRLDKEGAVRIFRSADAFQPPYEFWSTPMLWLESGNCMWPFRLLSNEPYTGHITASHKNEFSRTTMLATHSESIFCDKVNWGVPLDCRQWSDFYWTSFRHHCY